MEREAVAESILKHAAALPEGEPIYAKQLLALGERAAIDQALSRLAKSGTLMRVGRGTYVRPIQGRFGARAPQAEKVVAAIAEAEGEIIAPHGAAVANALGLTTQVPTKSVYLTSGRSRTLRLGRQKIELQHAPAWQLTLAGKPGGQVVQALAWLGPERAHEMSAQLKEKLPLVSVQEVARACQRLPDWMARQVSELVG